jgi:hypothetical protein
LLVALEPRREGKIMKGSWYLLGFLLVGLVFALPDLAQSDRPECPSDNPGACFVMDFGFFFSDFNDGEGDRVIAFTNSGEAQDWEQVLPNGTRTWHSWGEREMNFCPANTVSAERCRWLNPPARVFQGTGRMSLFCTLNANGGCTCPSVAHIRGSGTNGFGNSMEFTVDGVLVRSGNSGQCRFVTLEVEGTPLP